MVLQAAAALIAAADSLEPAHGVSLTAPADLGSEQRAAALDLATLHHHLSVAAEPAGQHASWEQGAGWLCPPCMLTCARAPPRMLQQFAFQSTFQSTTIKQLTDCGETAYRAQALRPGVQGISSTCDRHRCFG